MIELLHALKDALYPLLAVGVACLLVKKHKEVIKAKRDLGIAQGDVKTQQLKDKIEVTKEKVAQDDKDRLDKNRAVYDLIDDEPPKSGK